MLSLPFQRGIRLWTIISVMLCLSAACSGDSSAPGLRPTFSAVSPASGVQGTTITVTLTGTNFVPGGMGVLSLTGTGVTVSDVNVVSTTTVTARVNIAADAPLGTHTFTLGGESTPLNFTILPPAPTLASVSPAAVVAGTTSTLTLTGTNFVPGATTVSVSGAGVTVGAVTVVSATSLTVSVTVAAVTDLGARQVSVTTAGGTSGAQTLTINPPSPVLAGISPASGIAGTTVHVTLSGSSFVPGATTLGVAGSGVTVSNVVVQSPTSLTADFVIDAAATVGVHNVTVATISGASGASPFTVTAAAPVIGAYTAVPATIDLGQTSTLAWSGITNATSCAIDNGVGTISCSNGSRSVTPSSTTTYKLTATGPGGVVTANATVAIAPASIGAFDANPASIVLGNSSTLTWSGIQNATSCSINFGIGPVPCADGSIAVKPTSTRTYELTATGPGGNATASATVTVNVVAPTLTNVNPNIGVQGTTVGVTLTGTSFVPGATTVSVSGTGVTVNNVSVSSSTSLTADFVIAAGAALGTHNVTVTTASGTSGAQTFTVNPPPPTLTSVTPAQGAQGGTQSVTLVGTNFVTGATSVSVSGSNVTVSNVNVSSSQQLTADFAVALGAATGARNVTVTTAGGTSGAQTFTVIAGPVINTFAALATHLTVRQPTTVTWSTSNATSCSIVPTFFSVACNGSGIVTPGANTTYTLTASNAGASVNASTSVFVNEPGRWVFSSANLDNQLRMYSLNASTGDLTAIGGGTIASGTSPIDVTVDPAGKYAYTANSSGNNVSMYTINATTGALTPNGTIAAGNGSRAIAVDPTGRYAYVVNQNVNINGNPGSVSAYTINGSGQLVANGAAVTVGGQPTKVAIDPLGKYAYVVNFDQQNISMFAINANGTLASLGAQANTGGAFGVAADPTGRFVYATTHANGRVRAYGIGSNGTLIFSGDVAGTGNMTALTVDVTGHYVYALDGNNNVIHTYSINQITGNLTEVGGGVATGGGPSDVSVDPQGKFVYTANQAGTISIFGINQSTGALTLVNTVAAGNSPRGIVVSR